MMLIDLETGELATGECFSDYLSRQITKMVDEKISQQRDFSEILNKLERIKLRSPENLPLAP